jgi:hypothetical protein
MTATRCPKCQLVNMENAKRCRRCRTSLKTKVKPDASEQKLPWFKTPSVFLPLTAALLVFLGLSAYYIFRDSPADANLSSAVTITKAKPADSGDPGLRELRALYQDFIVRLDQNLANTRVNAIAANQSLVLEVQTKIGELQRKNGEAAVQRYGDEFALLLKQYADLCLRHDSESARLAEEKGKIDSEIAQVRQDTSLTEEARVARMVDLRRKLAVENGQSSIGAQDFDRVIESLRNFKMPDTIPPQ